MTQRTARHCPLMRALATLLAGLGVYACPCLGGDEFYLADYSHYGISEDDFNKMSITPVRMMDDETLFRAAEEERNNVMSVEQRLINNRWLVNDSNSVNVGAKALQAFCRANLLAVFKGGKLNKRYQNLAAHLVHEEDSAESTSLTNIDNYRIAFSGDKVALKFVYRFD